MLAEVILHGNHRDAARIVELMLSYWLGRGCAAVALIHIATASALIRPSRDVCCSSRGTLLDQSLVWRMLSRNLNSHIDRGYDCGR
jgi:hypothetical protein